MKIRSTDIALDGAANGSILKIGSDGIPVWGTAPAGSSGASTVVAAGYIDCTNPTAPVLRNAVNVSGIVRTGVGTYELTFTTPISDTTQINLSTSGKWNTSTGNQDTVALGIDRNAGFTTTKITLVCHSLSTNGNGSPIYDCDGWLTFVLESFVPAAVGTPHRYWKIYNTDNGGGGPNTIIGEIRWLDSNGNNLPWTSVQTNNDYGSGYVIGNINDGNPATAYIGSGQTGHYLLFDFANPVSATLLNIMASTGGGDWPAQLPVNFDIGYSDDGTTFTKVLSAAGIARVGGVYTSVPIPHDSSSSNAAALSKLSDVDITTTPPTAGQALVYDATKQKFVPGSVAASSGGGSGGSALGGIIGILRLAKTSTQTISSGAWRQLTWENEVEDTLNCFDNSTDNINWTVPAGIQRMRISASIPWSTPGGDRYIGLVRGDGTTIVADIRSAPNEAAGNLATVWIDVTAGEKYYIQVNSGGGSSNVSGPGGFIATGAQLQVEWATTSSLFTPVSSGVAGKHVIASKGPTDLVVLGQGNSAAMGTNISVPDMLGSIKLLKDATVEFSFNVSNARTGGKCRYHLFVDGALVKTGGSDSDAPAWYDTTGNDTTLSGYTRGFFYGSFVMPLTAGTHTVEIKYNDALAAGITNFYSRSLLWEIVDGTALSPTTGTPSSGGSSEAQFNYPDLTGFTWVNQRSATITYDGTGSVLACNAESTNSGAYTQLLTPAPSGNFDVYLRATYIPFMTTDYIPSAIVLHDSGAGRSLCFGQTPSDSIAYLQDMSDNGTFNGNRFNKALPRQAKWLRLNKTGTIVTGYVSDDGMEWMLCGSYDSTGLNLAQMGYGVYPHSNPMNNRVLYFSAAAPVMVRGSASNALPANITAQSWRLLTLVGSASTAYSGYGEVKFLDANGNSIAAGGTASASTVFDNTWPPANAFDGSQASSNGWLCVNGSGPGEWLQYTFVTPVSPASVVVYPVSNIANSLPQQIKIQYQLNGVWTTALTVSTNPGAANVGQTFILPTSSLATPPVSIGASTLATLNDVSVPTPTDGQSLVYDATLQKWVAETPVTGAAALSGLTDVAITSPADSQPLIYDAASQKWKPGAIIPVDTANYRVAPYVFADNPIDFPTTGLTWADEFDGPNIDFTKWSWINQTSNGVTMNAYIQDQVLNFVPTAGQGGWNFAGLLRNKPAGDFDIVMKAGLDGFPTNYNAVSLCVYNSTTGNFTTNSFHARADGQFYCTWNRWNGTNSLNTDNSYHVGKPYGYVRVALVGTTFTAYYSEFGRQWEVIGSEDVADFVGAGWDKIAIMVKSESTAHKVHALVHWIRDYHNAAGIVAGKPTTGGRAIVESTSDEVHIRQRAFSRVTGGTVNLTLPYPPKVGNMLVMMVTGYSGTKNLPSGWSWVLPQASTGTAIRPNQTVGIAMKYSDGTEQVIATNSSQDYGNFGCYEIENASAIRTYAIAPPVTSGTFSTTITEKNALKLFAAEHDAAGTWSGNSQFADFVTTDSINSAGNHTGFFAVLPSGFAGTVSATVTNENNTVLCYAAIEGRQRALVQSDGVFGAHRYWRVVGETAANRYLYINELVFAATTGGAQLATGGVPLESGHYANTDAQYAFDGNPSTFYEGNAAENTSQDSKWIGYDFGKKVRVGEVRISADPNPYPGEMLTTARVQYSDDGIVWTTGWQINASGWPTASGIVTQSFPNTVLPTTSLLSARVRARYWRIRQVRFAGGHTGWGATKVAFRDASGNSISTGNSAISSQPFSPGASGITWTPAAAFDGASDVNHGWYSGDDSELGTGGAAGSWLGYDFGVAVSPTSFEMAPLTSYSWSMPNTVAIDYSDDGVSWLPHSTVGMSIPGVDNVVQQRPIRELPRATLSGNPLPDFAGNAGKTLIVNESESGAKWGLPPVYGTGLYDLSKGVPLLSAITTVGTPGSYSYTENPGLALNVKSVSGSGKNELAGFLVPLTSMVGSWAVLLVGNYDNRSYVGQGIGLQNSTTGAFKTLCDLGGAQNSFANWTAYDNRTGQSEPGFGLDDRSGPVWWHADCDGTTFRMGISHDGVNPMWEFSEAVSTNLGSFDHLWFGLFWSSNNPQAGASTTALCVDLNAGTRRMGMPSGGLASKPWYFKPPSALAFTLTNSGIGNMALTNDVDAGLTLDCPTGMTTSTLNHAFAAQTVPVGSWTATMKMNGGMYNSEYLGMGMYLRTAAGQFYTFGQRTYGSNLSVMVNRWASATSFNSDVFRVDANTLSMFPWRRIVYASDTGLITFQVSVGGKVWKTVFSENQSILFAAPPSDVGLFMGGNVVTTFMQANVEYWVVA